MLIALMFTLVQTQIVLVITLALIARQRAQDSRHRRLAKFSLTLFDWCSSGECSHRSVNLTGAGLCAALVKNFARLNVGSTFQWLEIVIDIARSVFFGGTICFSDIVIDIARSVFFRGTNLCLKYLTNPCQRFKVQTILIGSVILIVNPFRGRFQLVRRTVLAAAVIGVLVV